MGAGLHWLVSYPKSGGTWLRVLLGNLLRDTAEPISINDIAVGPLAASREWLEDTLGVETGDLTTEEIQRLRADLYRWEGARATTPLFCKVHDAQARLPDGRLLFPPDAGGRAVYVVRNPLDVAVSLAFHMGCDLDEAIHRLGSAGHAIAARPDAGDGQFRQHLRGWSDHVRSWTGADAMPVHVLRYEDLHVRPVETLGAVAEFVGLPADGGRLRRAVDHSAFAVLRGQEERSGFEEASSKTDFFFRRGLAGGWREALSPAQVHRLVERHGAVMARFGYLDEAGAPL